MKLAYSEARQRFGELCLRVLDRGAARRRQRAGRGAPARARAHDRGGRVADPAQHHRRAGARPPEGAALMDLDLSDDQVALRDGIASMLEAGSAATASAPASIGRCSTSWPAPACSRCAPTASGGPTASVVFEQLGRYCVPGPLVASLLLGDGRIAGVVEDAGAGRGSSTSTRSTTWSCFASGCARRRGERDHRGTVDLAARSAHAGHPGRPLTGR